MQVPAFVTGSIAPVFTAFHEDGSLDDAGQRHLLEFMLERGGVSAYFVRSGMGQMYTFSMDDTKQIARTAKEIVSGKAAVLVGCSGIWDRNRDRLPDKRTYIAEAIELGKYVADLGVDGAVLTVPEGLRPEAGQSIADLIESYITEVCAAISCPVFLYQPPGTLPEYILPPALIAKLADIDNLLGMKASTNDAYYLSQVGYAVRGKTFGFIAGAETAFYAALYAGAMACIGQGTTINPHLINAVQDRFNAGDREGALEAQHDVNVLCEICPNPVNFFKRFATESGHPVGPTARWMSNNPYMEKRPDITDEEYTTFKRDFEEICAKY